MSISPIELNGRNNPKKTPVHFEFLLIRSCISVFSKLRFTESVKKQILVWCKIVAVGLFGNRPTKRLLGPLASSPFDTLDSARLVQKAKPDMLLPLCEAVAFPRPTGCLNLARTDCVRRRFAMSGLAPNPDPPEPMSDLEAIANVVLPASDLP